MFYAPQSPELIARSPTAFPALQPLAQHLPPTQAPPTNNGSQSAASYAQAMYNPMINPDAAARLARAHAAAAAAYSALHPYQPDQVQQMPYQTVAGGWVIPPLPQVQVPPTQYMPTPNPHPQHQSYNVPPMPRQQYTTMSMSPRQSFQTQHHPVPAHTGTGPVPRPRDDRGYTEVANQDYKPQELATGQTSPGSWGPPRKPRQTGYTLWVGNFPTSVDLVEAKDFFASPGLESIFVMRKSKCAFINYKTEATCLEALQEYNGREFAGVKLVCRLRKAPEPQTPSSAAQPQSSESAAEARERSAMEREKATAKNRYFIIKSLSKENLDLSLQNGVWATQAHNEIVLDQAYRSAENVYLIFSANKTGEYYGYARMTSPVFRSHSGSQSPEAVSANIEWKPAHGKQSPDATAVAAGSAVVATPKTDYVRSGRIVTDEYRNTVFWEADTDSDAESVAARSPDEAPQRDYIGGPEVGDEHSWGMSFRVEWIVTGHPLPFYKIRHLRNPWNANREVKVGRDGTELKPSVGERLCAEIRRNAEQVREGGQTHARLPPRGAYGAGAVTTQGLTRWARPEIARPARPGQVPLPTSADPQAFRLNGPPQRRFTGIPYAISNLHRQQYSLGRQPLPGPPGQLDPSPGGPSRDDVHSPPS
ncbi:hypothetical protein YB2330_003829 [Saitoella coloradoensis]